MSEKLSIEIVNVVAAASLNQPLDIGSILRVSPSAGYRPDRFPGLVYRLKRPKTATLIFSSGEMICTGARSESQAKRAILRIVKELKEKGITIPEKPDIRIVNIVASIDLKGNVDLEASAESLERTIYEPEQFPGLIHRMESPEVVMLLFSSGKAVCTRARKEEDVDKAGVALQQLLESKRLIYYE